MDLEDEAGHRLQLAVIIVNYRTAGLVIDCLQSLLPELAGLSARVVIVDNDSRDDSLQRIRHWLDLQSLPADLVALLQSASNGGFAAGNNLGIASVAAAYYLLLNSDTLVRPGAIHGLLRAAEDSPRAGLVGPRLEDESGRPQESCFRFHRPLSEFVAAAQTRLVSRCFPQAVVAMPVQHAQCHPEWISFACVLIRQAVFAQAGSMDEGYFLYFEDVEFCRRARAAGWDILHEPAACVCHLHGGSTGLEEQARLRARLPRYYYASRARYYFQAYGRGGLLAANLLWWLGRSLAKLRQLAGRSDKAEVTRRWLDIWINFRQPLRPPAVPAARQTR